MLYPNPQIYHHLKTIFVHVPKAARTSIEKHLRKTDQDVVGGHTTALAYRRKYPEEFATYFKFTVVRDPKQKLVEKAGIATMPSSFFLGRDGKVVYAHSGFHGSETRKQYVREIESLLKDAAK